MIKQTIYTVGGTVQASGGIYIKRKADDELLELCRAGELAFILSSRQVGKSSLMMRTAQQLEKEEIRSATVDLSAIGVNVTQDEWYLGILSEIATSLNMQSDIFSWWSEYTRMGPAQQFFAFLRDVLLKEIKERTVLFFDEIDTTLSIPFADDFFASLRAVYNARSTTPEFKRLSFVLVGVATPSDLISDSKRTPFNIGQRVDLTDFTREEALPLAQGLGGEAEQVLSWILDWTGGHPYLTQRLCANLSKHSGSIEQDTVAQAVEQLFFGDKGWQDNNVQFVRDLLVKRSPDVRQVMTTYMDIRSGKKVVDDERSIVKAHLKISGVVKRRAGHLVTRNRIYEWIFNPKWILENTPSAVPRRLAIGSTLVLMFALFISIYLVFQETSRTDAERAARFKQKFEAENATSPTRLENLAAILELNDDSISIQAIDLFNSLPPEEKLRLFSSTPDARVQQDQLAVTKGIYQSLANTTEQNAILEENEILEAMYKAIERDEPALAREIESWVDGRKLIGEDNPSAKVLLTRAIRLNNQNIEAGIVNKANPALYYDRAQVFINLQEYSSALDDLTYMIELDGSRGQAAFHLIQSDRELDRLWMKEQKTYERLVAILPTLTPTLIIPTRTIAPTQTRTPILIFTPSQTQQSLQIFCVSIPGAEAINVRSGPGTTYPPLGASLPVGKCLVFNALDEQGTWLQVAPNQPEVALEPYAGGWIMRDLLGLGSSAPLNLPAVTLTPTPTPTPTPFAPQKPDQFLDFYFDTVIYERDYELGWSLLSETFKLNNNPTGFDDWRNVWEKVVEWRRPTWHVTYITPTKAVVSTPEMWFRGASWYSLTDRQYCLVRDDQRNTWMIETRVLCDQ